MSKKLVSLFLAVLMLFSAAALAEEAITVTDMFGRVITLEEPATRIIATEPADCEILYALGCGDALVGRGLYCDYPAEVTALPTVHSGADTNLEEIPTTSSKAQLQSGIVVIDNRTGDIVGLSGGVGEKIDHDGFNRAVDAKLQTGSAQKPVSVYAPAFESGAVSPATPIKDMPITYDGGNFPKNDNRKYDLWRNVYNGVVSSVNTISIGTLQKVGFEYAFSFAQEGLGLNNLVREYQLSNGNTLSDLGYSPLGMGALTVGASVREMSNAYATFANNGIWREARTYTKVYDSEGNLVLDNTQETRQVMGEKAVNYMNLCLFGAANNGTGGAAVFPGMNIAGKTGTTSSNRDRWFCGFTPHYTAAVWCGFDKPEQIRLTGSNANPACRLWKKVMEPIHKGLPNEPLYNGDKFSGYTICLDTGKIATAACEKDVRGGKHTSFAYCYKEDIEGQSCDQHVLVDYCVTGGGVATEYCHTKAIRFSTLEAICRALECQPADILEYQPDKAQE